MTTELVLLSEVPVMVEVHHRAYTRLGMTGEMFKWLGGQLAALHDESRRHVLTVHTSMAIHDTQKVAAALVGPPETPGLQSEIMVPFDNTEKGRIVAEAVAIEVNGLIRERM